MMRRRMSISWVVEGGDLMMIWGRRGFGGRRGMGGRRRRRCYYLLYLL
jgi:hypothetical protein